MEQPIPQVPEIAAAALTSAVFHDGIVPAYRPVVIRGLVRDWPVSRAAMDGPQALVTYLKRFDGGRRVTTKAAPPAVAGRFTYDAQVAGFNFHKEAMSVGDALDRVLALAGDADAPAFAIQSARAGRYFPGFADDNRLALLPETISPRLWIGNAVTVAAHYDVSENIACCVAGRRRVTLFPPDQVANLYAGPFELTPGGQIVSMVDFDAPDGNRFPRFAQAMRHAVVVDLEPGDALYIPYLWWHHVRSLEPINLLVNFWWPPTGKAQPHAPDAMLLAMLSIKDLPPARRDAWRALFGHYVFGDDGPPGLHIPAGQRGVQGIVGRATGQVLLDDIARRLAPKARSAFLGRIASLLRLRR